MNNIYTLFVLFAVLCFIGLLLLILPERYHKKVQAFAIVTCTALMVLVMVIKPE